MSVRYGTATQGMIQFEESDGILISTPVSGLTIVCNPKNEETTVHYGTRGKGNLSWDESKALHKALKLEMPEDDDDDLTKDN
tara:strand:- start:391 stop:636 length:246 start_codon:yes stop_codon:yes gene_type:complete